MGDRFGSSRTLAMSDDANDVEQLEQILQTLQGSFMLFVKCFSVIGIVLELTGTLCCRI